MGIPQQGEIAAASEASIPERFASQACRFPDRLAVQAGGRGLTYAELDAFSDSVAAAVLDARGPGEEPVAVLLTKDVRFVVAFLGVLKAGKAMVPLEPSFPAARLAHIRGSSDARLVVTEAAHRSLAAALGDGSVTLLDIDAIKPLGKGRPSAPISPDALATILYTSGSTGEPKGVAQNHRGTLHNALNHQQYLGLVPEDRLAMILAGSTVGSVRDLWAALITGASVHPFDVRAGGFEALANWIRDERITYINMVVTLFRHFVAALPASARFPSVRVVRAGSERMAPVDLEAFRRHFPSTGVFYTGLGTTETGSVTGVLFSAGTPVSEGGVGVGRPLADMEALALDEAGHPVPCGEVGEIAVRSRYVALNYWRRPDLSAPVFRPDPEGGDNRIYLTGDLGRLHRDGSLELLGRKDDQVKIRGHRVVLSEVERALLALPGVKQAAVVIRERYAGEPKMVGYVATTGQPPRPHELRGALQVRLPAHMIPAVFVTLPVLPSSPGGKLDRRALPEPDWERAEPGTSPRTPLEAQIATLWAEALGVDTVGVTDSFISLGGDSLLAMRLVATICAELQLPLQPSDLLAAATVADMAVEVTAVLLEQAPASVRETLLSAEQPSGAEGGPPGA